MPSRAVLIAVSLMTMSYAQAGIVVQLVPENTGPYFGGESFTVDVWLESEHEFDLWLRSVQFYFSDTDPLLGLDSTFAFDLTSLDSPGFFRVFPELPVPWTYLSLECDCPDLYFYLPIMGSLHIGSIGVELPTEIGIYQLDVLNADEPDPDLFTKGAVFDVEYLFDFDVWSAYTGEITGGSIDFVVIPEPSSLWLISLGCSFLVVRNVSRGRHRLSLDEKYVYPLSLEQTRISCSPPTADSAVPCGRRR